MEVVQATGASYRQLDYWARKGLVTPLRSETQHVVPRSVADPSKPGSGRVRIWDDSEVAVIAVMVTLTRWGLTPTAAAAAGRRLATDGVVGVAPGVTLSRTP